MRSKGSFVLVATIVMVFAGTVRGGSVPSGERQLGKTIIEPAYDDQTGKLIYLSTPLGVPFPSKSNSHAWSPLYLIVYPSSAADSVGPMNCQHEGGDNCPDHGPDVAGAAAFINPDVYGAGVWGHDHLVDAPGGSEFNVAWQVILVLFTNADAASTHITTEEQLDAAIEAGDAFEIETPIVFNCSVVPAAPYNRATPLPTVD